MPFTGVPWLHGRDVGTPGLADGCFGPLRGHGGTGKGHYLTLSNDSHDHRAHAHGNDCHAYDDRHAVQDRHRPDADEYCRPHPDRHCTRIDDYRDLDEPGSRGSRCCCRSGSSDTQCIGVFGIERSARVGLGADRRRSGRRRCLGGRRDSAPKRQLPQRYGRSPGGRRGAATAASLEGQFSITSQSQIRGLAGGVCTRARGGMYTALEGYGNLRKPSKLPYSSSRGRTLLAARGRPSPLQRRRRARPLPS